MKFWGTHSLVSFSKYSILKWLFDTQNFRSGLIVSITHIFQDSCLYMRTHACLRTHSARQIHHRKAIFWYHTSHHWRTCCCWAVVARSMLVVRAVVLLVLATIMVVVCRVPSSVLLLRLIVVSRSLGPLPLRRNRHQGLRWWGASSLSDSNCKVWIGRVPNDVFDRLMSFACGELVSEVSIRPLSRWCVRWLTHSSPFIQIVKLQW